MIETVTTICIVILTAAVLAGLWRMVLGPTTLDRILSFDMIAICSVAFMGILSIRWNSEFFLELILIFTLLGFFGTAAFLFFLQGFSLDEKGRPESTESADDE
jgi:multisubunit Na+/H+ antiporter MnhF subunit